MKIKACDVCLTEGKLLPSGWLMRVRHPEMRSQMVRVDICTGHKEALRGRGYEAALDVVVKAEQAYNAAVRS
jgi:hypothetical protein